MNKLQQQLMESCINITETKSYSNQMDKRRQEEQLILDARIRNIKKAYEQKYEKLHSTYLFQCEQLKQQLHSEIKKEMYSFEVKMNKFLNKISVNDKYLLKGGISIDYSDHFNSSRNDNHNHNHNNNNQNSIDQQNSISQTINTEQGLNKDNANELFNFVDSYDNSLFNKNNHNNSCLQHQSSIATFNNQQNSFRTIYQPNNMQGQRNGQMHEELNDTFYKTQSANLTWNKENLLDQSDSFLNNSFKNNPILKNNKLKGQNNNNARNSQNYHQNENVLQENTNFDNIFKVNQNLDNQISNQKSRNWEEIKKIRQQCKQQQQQLQQQKNSQQSQYKQKSFQDLNQSCISQKQREKSYSTHENYNKRHSLYENNIQRQSYNNERLNNSFQTNSKQNSFTLNKKVHNLSFKNLNETDNHSFQQRCSSESSSDSEGGRQLDTDRLKKFKIDSICLMKNSKQNNSKLWYNQQFYKQ